MCILGISQSLVMGLKSSELASNGMMKKKRGERKRKLDREDGYGRDCCWNCVDPVSCLAKPPGPPSLNLP
jgi:hypothetical protein